MSYAQVASIYFRAWLVRCIVYKCCMVVVLCVSTPALAYFLPVHVYDQLSVEFLDVVVEHLLLRFACLIYLVVQRSCHHEVRKQTTSSNFLVLCPQRITEQQTD